MEGTGGEGRREGRGRYERKGTEKNEDKFAHMQITEYHARIVLKASI